MLEDVVLVAFVFVIAVAIVAVGVASAALHEWFLTSLSMTAWFFFGLIIDWARLRAGRRF